MAAKFAQLIDWLAAACFNCPTPSRQSLNDWIVQLQIAERTPLRRLPLRERNDAWYLRRNDACSDGATLK
jgi:hypothetical protein